MHGFEKAVGELRRARTQNLDIVKMPGFDRDEAQEPHVVCTPLRHVVADRVAGEIVPMMMSSKSGSCFLSPVRFNARRRLDCAHILCGRIAPRRAERVVHLVAFGDQSRSPGGVACRSARRWLVHHLDAVIRNVECPAISLFVNCERQHSRRLRSARRVS